MDRRRLRRFPSCWKEKKAAASSPSRFPLRKNRQFHAAVSRVSSRVSFACTPVESRHARQRPEAGGWRLETLARRSMQCVCARACYFLHFERSRGIAFLQYCVVRVHRSNRDNCEWTEDRRTAQLFTAKTAKSAKGNHRANAHETSRFACLLTRLLIFPFRAQSRNRFPSRCAYTRAMRL
jgi:hypothetical protein